MARLETRRWEADPTGLTRRDRSQCDYSVYFPDGLSGQGFFLDGEVAREIAAAEAALIRLNSEARTLNDTEALARLLLRAESVASSRIEGLEVGGRRLLRAAALRESGEEPRDVTAVEVLGNIDAMLWAIGSIDSGAPITVELLTEAHRRLLAGTRHEEHGGKLRTVQNWIGGGSHNPCRAVFVPPPADAVLELLQDLCAFCESDALPALALAAIAHAQFETIHPFVDGNGRTGRALLHLILRRRGLATRVLPPISLILATWPEEYIEGLTNTRYVGPAGSPGAIAGINSWISFFSSAYIRAVEDAHRFESQVERLQDSWRERTGPVRGDSALALLIGSLPAAPVLNISIAARLIGRSFQATSQAIERLVEAGVLIQVNVGRRNRAFEAPELIDLFNAFERQLASPEGDTRISEPARRVPRRPQTP